MSTRIEEKEIYFGFWASVLLKGAISLTEIIASILILAIPTSEITNFAHSIAQSGLLGSTTGTFATYFLKSVAAFTRDTQVFVALYLFVRGAVKLLVLIALLKNKIWAYPATLVVLGALVLFQLYQILTTHSLTVVAITLFDLVVMFFVWSEYQIVKRHHGLRKEEFASTDTE